MNLKLKSIKALEEMAKFLAIHGITKFDGAVDIRKDLEAFKIIKDKRVNVTELMEYATVDQYNEWVEGMYNRICFDFYTLTQEEFNLLKERLKINSDEILPFGKKDE